MPTVQVDARNLQRALQDHFATRRASLMKATEEVAHRGVAHAVGLTNADGLVYLGAYKRGFKVVPPVGDRGAVLRNDTPYAAVTEWGRRPMRPGPPVAPIREWVRLKLGLSGDELERATFLIRRHIHIHGSRPHLIMHRTYLQMKGWFKAEAERRLRAGI